MIRIFRILTALLIFATTGCDIQKRQYMKGFYVAHKKHHATGSTAGMAAKVSEPKRRLSDIVRIPSEERRTVGNEISGSEHESGFGWQARMNYPRQILNEDSCKDVLIYKDGTELLVRVEEVAEDYIAYRPCEHLDGPLRKVSPDNIFMIKYANGSKEVIQHTPKVSKQQDAPDKKTKPANKRKNFFAQASFFLSFFFIFYFIPSVISLIFGLIALEQMKRQPDKYKNKWMAVTGMIISGIFVSILILVIMFG